MLGHHWLVVDSHAHGVYRHEHNDTEADHSQDRSEETTDELNMKYTRHDSPYFRNIPQLRLVISNGHDMIPCSVAPLEFVA